MSATGIYGLSWGTHGWRIAETTNKPVHKPADLASLKIRIQPSPFFNATFKAIGAVPVVMDITELYLALSQSTVQGMEVPFIAVASSKLYEVTKQAALTNQVYNASILMASKSKLDSLDPKHQDAIRQVGKEIGPIWSQAGRPEDGRGAQAQRRRGHEGQRDELRRIPQGRSARLHGVPVQHRRRSRGQVRQGGFVMAHRSVSTCSDLAASAGERPDGSWPIMEEVNVDTHTTAASHELTPGRFSRLLDIVCAAIIPAAVAIPLVVIFANVVTRSAFDLPLVWTDEVAKISLATLAFIGGAIAYRQGCEFQVRLALGPLMAGPFHFPARAKP